MIVIRNYNIKIITCISKILMLYISKRFMKKITSQALTEIQRKRITLHVQEFISSNFKDVINNKEELLYKNIQFMTHKNINENILNQTLLKTVYPKYSFIKKQLIDHMKISFKVEVSSFHEKTDWRFIAEIDTASKFANSSELIKKVTMNSEHPSNLKNLQAIVSSGNKYKDVSVTLDTSTNIYNFELDIKSGNNANKVFSGILASVPYIQIHQPYKVINEGISLHQIQIKRFEYLFHQSETSKRFKEMSIYVEHLNNLPLDDIHKNLLIQEQIFKLLSENMLSQRPSFYHAFIMEKQPILHQLFFERLNSYITPNIFDNIKNAQTFMKQAFIIYMQTVEDISNNIERSKNAWMNTGFEHIAHDIFK